MLVCSSSVEDELLLERVLLLDVGFSSSELLVLSEDDKDSDELLEEILLEEGSLEDTELSELTFSLELELVEDVCVTVLPSFVFVTVFTATFVAPSAKTTDITANGVMNGGVRYAILIAPFLNNIYIAILKYI